MKFLITDLITIEESESDRGKSSILIIPLSDSNVINFNNIIRDLLLDRDISWYHLEYIIIWIHLFYLEELYKKGGFQKHFLLY
jgi:hypothetical protein